MISDDGYSRGVSIRMIVMLLPLAPPPLAVVVTTGVPAVCIPLPWMHLLSSRPPSTPSTVPSTVPSSAKKASVVKQKTTKASAATLKAKTGSSSSSSSSTTDTDEFQSIATRVRQRLSSSPKWEKKIDSIGSIDSVDGVDGNVIIVLVVKSQLHKSLFVFSV